MEQKVTIGRTVHYVLPAGPRKGEHRAAIVTGCFVQDRANLTVFLDQPDDTLAAEMRGYVIRERSVEYDPTGTVPGSWHWPERD